MSPRMLLACAVLAANAGVASAPMPGSRYEIYWLASSGYWAYLEDGGDFVIRDGNNAEVIRLRRDERGDPKLERGAAWLVNKTQGPKYFWVDDWRDAGRKIPEGMDWI